MPEDVGEIVLVSEEELVELEERLVIEEVIDGVRVDVEVRHVPVALLQIPPT